MELCFDELTAEQKIGLIFTGTFYHGTPDIDFTLDLIRRHALGAAWVNPTDPRRDDLIRKIRDAADYPIVICCDAETGNGDYKIGQAISLAYAGSDPALGYSFGKATACQLHALGYNLVYNPVLDMCLHDVPCGMTARSYGNDPERVSALAIAIGRGMHDGGLLTGGKHYPGEGGLDVDTHMQEGISEKNEEELLAYELRPYTAMIRAGILDSVMTGHFTLPKIDPDRPASLSQPVLDILRRQGFDGVYMTDALSMMGIVLKFGRYACCGLAAAAGNELALPWGISNKEAYEALCEAYRTGVLTKERLDTSVRRVLALQHKAAVLSAAAEARITEEDKENFRKINEDCIIPYIKDGICPALDKNGKHLFVLLVDNEDDRNIHEEAPIGPDEWYTPHKIVAKIRSVFPNSDAASLRAYPTPSENNGLFMKQLEYDDVVFISFWQSSPCVGRERLTARVIGMLDALQSTNRVSALLHFGNPYILEELPHFDRIFVGCCSAVCTLRAIDVLAGDAQALGTPVYPVKLK